MQPSEATTIRNFLLGTIRNEHETTLRVLAAVPAERSAYTPDAKSMTALDLAWHIASSEIYFMEGSAAGAFPAGEPGRPESMGTPTQIIDWYREQHKAALAKVASMSGEDCTRVISFHGMFEAPAIGYLQLMITHAVHHRGQLSAYLRPMGAKVPSIYGPSGDAEIGKPAEA